MTKLGISSLGTATVHIVDDSSEVRESVGYLVESIGLQARSYATAESFLTSFRDETAGCLILDLRMPGPSGLETLGSLPAYDIHLPVIIMTGHGDVPAAVRALKLGAVDFLEKPCNDQTLIESVNRAIEIDVRLRAERSRLHTISTAVSTLTRREVDVLELLVTGNSNKEVARALDLSPKTVERHRARIMDKAGVSSFAELVSNVSLLKQKSATVDPLRHHVA